MIALAALAAILGVFAFLYFNARTGQEKGTSSDDSPAAEAGTRKSDSNAGDHR
jgi:hypothetical protein